MQGKTGPYMKDRKYTKNRKCNELISTNESTKHLPFLSNIHIHTNLGNYKKRF